MSHELYLQLLSAMFLFWNGARVLTYIPTIGKLLAKGADVRSYSLLSWGCWALSNGTFALMLLEMSRGIPNTMFWMNLANTLMCLVVSFIILFRRFPRLQAWANGYRSIARHNSQHAAVAEAARSWHWGASNPYIAVEVEGISAAAVSRARSGFRARWAAVASTAAIGGTCAVAFGIWLNQDLHGYVEGTASARPERGITGPVLPMQPASLLPQVPKPSLTPARGTVVANAERAPAEASARPGHRAAPRLESARRQLAGARPAHANHPASQNHRSSASHMTASARQAPAIAETTLPIRQTSSPSDVAPAPSLPDRGTAVAGAEMVPSPPSASIVPSPPSASFQHRASASRSFAVPRPNRAWPAEANNFVTQNRWPPTEPVPAYESPPPLVYEAPPGVPQRPLVVYMGRPVVYQEAPVVHPQAMAAYGYAYEDEYWARHWHGNGRHKGWKTQRPDGDDDE